ncbi:MAG: LpxI family protein, partial [Pseudomonadota bacterium]|nr:LpxI family protein [Pseudomonadota bacterium]
MIALIAGRGALPAELIARLPERPMVCAMAG